MESYSIKEYGRLCSLKVDTFPGDQYEDKPIPLSENEYPRLRDWCSTQKDEAKRLGLEVEPGRDALRASHWVGLVWIDPSEGQKDKISLLRVSPKVKTKKLSSELVLLEKCLWVPQVAARLFARAGIEKKHHDNKGTPTAFQFWPDEPPIIVEKEDVSAGIIFLIVLYLQRLKDLCKRHLKRRFPAVRENLMGKVRGRILIGENLRRNLARGRPDRVICRFQVHSLDTKENQILKAALEVSLSYLRTHSIQVKPIWAMAQECRNVLSSVALRRIFPGEFNSLVFSGMMMPYKKPIQLAKIILKKLGPEPNPERLIENKIEIFPYAINMSELFERYCETLLRTEGIDDGNGKRIKPKSQEFWPGNEDLQGVSKHDINDVIVRPDFIFIDDHRGAVVADAKYKMKWLQRAINTETPNTTRPDVYQVIAYSRHKGVRNKIGELRKDNNSKGPDVIYIFYPKWLNGESSRAKTIKSFDIPIEAIPVSI